jgi:hypothetical protein
MNFHHDHDHDCGCKNEKPKDRQRVWHKHNDSDKHHHDWDKHRDWHKHNPDKHDDRDKHKDRDKDFHDCGCKKDRDNDDNEKHSRSCVCKKVRDINDAQHEVDRKKHGCDVSCDRSIKELLNQSKHSDFDTIPFKLLCGCKGDCETFVGTGVVKMNGCFYDIQSSFFRVVDFVKGSECCAILELLCPERCEGKHNGIEGFIRTGACFEVDLKDFTGITCFPPVKAKKMDHKKILCSDSKKNHR